MKATIRKTEKRKKNYEFDAVAFTYNIGENKTKDFARLFTKDLPVSIIEEKIGLDIQRRMKMFSSELQPTGVLWYEDFEDILDAVKEHVEIHIRQEKEKEEIKRLELEEEEINRMLQENIVLN